ncbi:nitrate reductase [Paracoccus laeviglucosivorans]|uniref:Assimilatory nitrate reductase (NADH) alpha subunit apoprotein n=1 Tax=Paracoccus laeviglucosivorans TaxID=1197861 RepID=A0A521BFY5_9RHOB|nr:nitrate reductase [Paracoccus laeviglucosivorans]SMO46016.1 assimilatory nitrate reductase (NADH) alpha subunit apoprotein [Paracoccus laeviglucosivorans]
MNMHAAPAIRTTCPYCGVGCGVLATPDGMGGLAIAGDPDHPANRGRLCVKGSALGETLGLKGRLLTPRIHGQDAGWDQALDLVARRFSQTIAQHGPDSVAMYVSGQLLTEDYYVANKLMKGFVGSANIDTNSRLCMASSVAGHRRAFGTDTVPGLYEDFELADTVVLVGSNLAWCHPVLYQRLVAARETRGTKVIVIDPRRTATCDIADLHLALAPGADAALFNLLLAHLDRRGLIRDFPVSGLPEALLAARATSPAATGLSHSDLQRFLEMWSASERVVTVYSQGINQSDSGADKVNAILNCHLATGRIGRPGMGPFSVTGQPNAMGGREVGGLANMLACHLDIENAAHRAAVADFWAAPRMADKPGLKAVDMFRAVEAGRIKALWIVCTNPAVSMPEADRVARAIRDCEFVVVSDMMAQTDTTRLAHVLLPATGWGEKDGTVTNSERRISRQRRTIPPAGQARDDWRIIADVARRMGWADAFAWQTPAQVFAEHAALSGVAGELGSDFDISDHAAVSTDEYDALQPFLWPQSARQRGGRFFGNGRFHTPDGKARMLAVTPRTPAKVTPAHPFRLNTGRVRDHWHTMTRSGMSPRLSRHIAEPFLEIHPSDAAHLGLAPATLAQVESPHGRAVLRVLVTDRVAPGHPFAPIHWTGETAPSGRVDALVPAAVDPVSGQPALKSAAVAIRPYAAAWYGFAVSARAFRPACDYWAVAALPGGYQAELAGTELPSDWLQAAGLDPSAEPLTLRDDRRGLLRMAVLREGRLRAALFVSDQPVGLSRSHVAAALGGECGPDILAGRAGDDRPDEGALVCACLGIGVNTIMRAIATGRLVSVEEIGRALGAGTNCGSCRPELGTLLARATAG